MGASAVRALSPRGWALLGLAFVTATVLDLRTTTQWGSDSRYYLAWTYRYLGHSDAEAARLTRHFLVGVDGLGACRLCWPDDLAGLFFGGGGLAVVGPRLVTPAMSAPFVAVLGPPGMLVPTVRCEALATVLVVVLASRLWGRSWGLAAGLLMLVPSVSRYGVFAVPEAPAILFRIACPLPLPLLALGLLTGPQALALAAGVGVAWLAVALRDRRAGSPWLLFALAGAAVAVATTAVQSLVAAPPHLLRTEGWAPCRRRCGGCTGSCCPRWPGTGC